MAEKPQGLYLLRRIWSRGPETDSCLNQPLAALPHERHDFDESVAG